MAGFTGAARSRHSGCGSGRGLPREVARNTTEPLGALLRGYPRRAASAMASGGSPARRRSPYWSKLQATIPSPKQRTGAGEAHRGLERVKLQRGIDDVELLRRRTALGMGAGRCGTPPASGLRGSARGAPERLEGGSGRAKILRRRAIAREWTHRRGWLRVENPSAAWRKPWSCGPKEGRGALAKLRRG